MRILIRIKNLSKVLLDKTIRVLNSFSNKKQCYVCKSKFYFFTKYSGGSKEISDYRKNLRMIGSDLDNFGCMYCGSHDRERHLMMFFDKLNLWGNMKEGRLLHFAPEKHLSVKIIEQAPLEYIKADLYPVSDDIQRIDATDLPFSDESFNFVIANHLLEHIPDYSMALCEFYRVLTPGGIAILQTPYSKLLKSNFEDEYINTDELRLFFHGQEDHVRTFGEYEFLKSIENVGFKLNIIKHKDMFDKQSALYYGVNEKEDFIQVIKPAQHEL